MDTYIPRIFQWKEHEEEVTHTAYIKRQEPYCPNSRHQGNHLHAQVHMWQSCVRVTQLVNLVVIYTTQLMHRCQVSLLLCLLLR